MKKNTFCFIFLLATTILFGNCKSASGLNLSPAGTVEGVYKTTFRSLTLTANDNFVSGTYESGNGKLDGTLNGNKLSGTWTNRTSGKNGKFEFVFSSDFSSLTGKYGYNDSAPVDNYFNTLIHTVRNIDYRIQSINKN